MKIRPAFARVSIFGAVVLFGLVVVPIGFMAGLVGGMPNRLGAPLVDQWPLLKTLWASNPGAMVRILLQQPVLAVAHSEPGSGVPAWRLFLYPVPLVVQLAVSIFASVILCSGARGAMRRRLVSLFPGMAALVFVTTYVQVASCCTGGPRWVLDIWLFSLAYDPLNTLVDWQRFYQRVEGTLAIVQIVLALFGTALLARHAGRNS